MNKLDYECTGIGFFKALSMVLGIMFAVVAAGLSLVGCQSTGQAIDDILGVVTNATVVSVIDLGATTTETNAQDSADAASVDDVPFDSLVWSSGGFSPASATVVKGNISAVAFDGRTITYSATVDDDWGTEGTAPNATICAVFFLGSDGVWRGGKFDWIGNLGRPRPAQHIASYSGWKHAYPAASGEQFAYVLIRGDNKAKRTNVIKGVVK